MRAPPFVARRFAMLSIVAALHVALLAIAPAALAAGDPEKGKALHESCLQCHGTELYVPPKRKVKTLKELERETLRWGGYYNPKLSKQEVADLVAWLNRDFYKFAR
jgi:mono/diheme cytochrome c family protein